MKTFFSKMTAGLSAVLLGSALFVATLGLAPLAVSVAPAYAGEVAASADAPGQVAETQANSTLDYKLGAGDKLRLNVFGEQDLSGEFDVTGTGKVSLPLIGQVQAAGLTLNAFSEEVSNKLREGYLTNPKVSVEVLNYRPFYIIGEVSAPGQYPYTDGMTVLNAVAVAGGFTYRANEDKVFITRGNSIESGYQLTQAVKVLPGDIVRIPERFF